MFIFVVVVVVVVVVRSVLGDALLNFRIVDLVGRSSYIRFSPAEGYFMMRPLLSLSALYDYDDAALEHFDAFLCYAFTYLWSLLLLSSSSLLSAFLLL